MESVQKATQTKIYFFISNKHISPELTDHTFSRNLIACCFFAYYSIQLGTNLRGFGRRLLEMLVGRERRLRAFWMKILSVESGRFSVVDIESCDDDDEFSSPAASRRVTFFCLSFSSFIML